VRVKRWQLHRYSTSTECLAYRLGMVQNGAPREQNNRLSLWALWHSDPCYGNGSTNTLTRDNSNWSSSIDHALWPYHTPWAIAFQLFIPEMWNVLTSLHWSIPDYLATASRSLLICALTMSCSVVTLHTCTSLPFIFIGVQSTGLHHSELSMPLPQSSWWSGLKYTLGTPSTGSFIKTKAKKN